MSCAINSTLNKIPFTREYHNKTKVLYDTEREFGIIRSVKPQTCQRFKIDNVFINCHSKVYDDKLVVDFKSIDELIFMFENFELT